MSALRTLTAISVAAGLGLLIISSGCSVSPVGVEACRDIEMARCQAGQACGIVSDLSECKRFYRDHCLHGLALEESPSAARVRSCVKSLKAVEACTREQGSTVVPLTQCPDATQSSSSLNLACDAVGAPEELGECAFLIEKEPEPLGDAGAEADSASSETGADATDQ